MKALTTLLSLTAVLGLSVKQARTEEPPDPDVFGGQVLGISDGDTITILLGPDKTQRTIRLYGIDAPEVKQPYGEKSKQALSDKIFGKSISFSRVNTDRNGCMTAWAFIYEPNKPLRYFNLEMAREGFAWHDVKYAPDDAELAGAEKDARAAKRGLWADAAPVAPWEFRRTKKATR